MDNLQEVKIVYNDSFKDYRGELWTIYNSNQIEGINFNHDKITKSKYNVLRGLHSDKSYKFITCLYGKIQLVIVNFKEGSDQYLQHQSFILDAANPIKTSILIPPYFLNGHLVLSKEAIFHYKWSYEGNYPDVMEQISINWADPTLKVNWLSKNPILSDRDRNSKFISNI